MRQNNLMWKEINSRSGQSGGTLDQGKRMRLIGQPSLTETLSASFNARQNPLGTRGLEVHRSNRHLSLSDAEEDSDVAPLRNVNHDSGSKIRLCDSLTWLELEVCRHEILG
jgi:hypothetical protein